MELLNAVHIDTKWGYKTFELYQGDVTNLDSVDLLAVSVLVGDYSPVFGTVVGSLQRKRKLSVRELLSNCEFDLRESFSCWVSKPIVDSKIGRILCVELLRPGFPPEDVVQNLFVVLAMLEAKGIRVCEFALPLLGTGLVGLEPEKVIAPLLHHAQEHFRRSQWLKRIRFVEINPDRARQLDNAMNEALDRVKVVLPRGDLADEIRRRILSHVDEIALVTIQDKSELLGDLRNIVSDEESRSFEIGIVGRRLVECIVDEILQGDQAGNLFSRLEKVRHLSKPGRIAEWILIYMHVLRVLGNESAHEMDRSTRIPKSIDEADVELCLLCIDQVLRFWLRLGAHPPIPAPPIGLAG